MRFRSDKQRKAVMAKLQMQKYSNMDYNQLKREGIKLDPKEDTDKDGVINIKDCKPLNKTEQGRIHDFVKKTKQKLTSSKKIPVSDKPRIRKALDNLKNKTTIKAVREWYKRNRSIVKALTVAGITLTLPINPADAIFLAALYGTGTLAMQRKHDKGQKWRQENVRIKKKK